VEVNIFFDVTIFLIYTAFNAVNDLLSVCCQFVVGFKKLNSCR